MMRVAPLLILLIISVLSGCRKDADVTPRRYAYPRVEAYDTVYGNVAVGPVELCVNSSAEISSPRPGWLDISYPRYGATIHVSAVATDNIAEVMANRRERIALNLGGSRATTHSFRAGDFDCTVVECAEAGMTPVQLLAASPEGIVVSGAANIAGSVTPVDSIRPVVAALTADAIKMLSALHDD
ncbi:MAG: hypothetical protein J6C95_03735 [Muribaculaceae bacterium]|nr:hypothetical protein [Muribaculaceae bacterium]